MSDVVSPRSLAEEPLAGEVAVDPATGGPAARGPAVTVPLAVAVSGTGLVGLGLALDVPVLVFWWTAAVFLGQFVCPLVALGFSDAIDGPGSALGVVPVVVRSSRQGRVEAPAAGG